MGMKISNVVEGLSKYLDPERLNADNWYDQYQMYRDTPSMRNLAFAIGKYVGKYNLVLELVGDEKQIPEIHRKAYLKYARAWEHL